MINRKNIGRIFGICLAAIYAPLILIGIYSDWSKVNVVLGFLLFGALSIALYWVGIWVELRDERNKKLPMSSGELRRRTKDFYEWLSSRGRR
jgi:hypothetical protein